MELCPSRLGELLQPAIQAAPTNSICCVRKECDSSLTLGLAEKKSEKNSEHRTKILYALHPSPRDEGEKKKIKRGVKEREWWDWECSMQVHPHVYVTLHGQGH